MFSKKPGNRRAHTYVTLTVGALATIGAIGLIKCGKKSMKCMRDKMCSMFKRDPKSCAIAEE